jgi:hypothetical protein
MFELHSDEKFEVMLLAMLPCIVRKVPLAEMPRMEV